MPVKATRTITVLTSAATAISTATSWIPTNLHETPFNVGFGVVLTGDGSMTYKVEHTFDDVQDRSVTPTPFTNADVSAATESMDGNYAYPVRAIRLATVTANGSARATLTVIQAGI